MVFVLATNAEVVAFSVTVIPTCVLVTTINDISFVFVDANGTDEFPEKESSLGIMLFSYIY